GAQLLQVPYKGSAPMLTDLLGGQVQVAFDNLPASLEHIRAGKLRALAVSTAARLETIPEVPALAEFLPGFETSSWLAVGAPSKTAPEIVHALNKEINAALPIPGLSLGSRVWARPCWQSQRPVPRRSLTKKPKNGERSLGSQAPSRTDLAEPPLRLGQSQANTGQRHALDP